MSHAHLLLFLLSSCSLLFSSRPVQSLPYLFPKESLPTQSGYLPIPNNASLFFAFYEAIHPASPLPQTPLVIWLQGGPGCSSLLGNFFELGPYLVSPTAPILSPNPFSWNRIFGLLFIDSPLGTGFSVAPSPSDIPRNQSVIGAHLFAALCAFLDSNPAFKTRPVYIAGESYGGKYVPAFGYYVLQQNDRINLQGVAIGNGLTHPVAQVNTHADSGYFTGLINARQKAILEELQSKAVRLTNDGNWSEAATARTKVLDTLQNMTGLATLYDLRKNRPYQSQMVAVLLNKEEVREALGAKKGTLWEDCSDAVGEAMQEDIMKSVKFMVEELVKKSKVLLYQGLFDLRDGVVSTEAWVKEMQWEGIDKFLEAERKVWRVDGELAGYVQSSGSLTQVVISGAGHLVPADQGRSSQAMIEDWVLEKGLFGNPKRKFQYLDHDHTDRMKYEPPL